MYYRTTAGNLGLEELQQLIIDEELGASKFVECKVAELKTGETKRALKNLIKFVELDAGTIPPDPTLKAGNIEAADGKSSQWTGVMLVKGSMSVVTLLR